MLRALSKGGSVGGRLALARRAYASDPTLYDPDRKQVDFRAQKKVAGVVGTTYMSPQFGVPAGKKPIKVDLKQGEKVVWCACGYSENQPYCDGSHNKMGLTLMRPVHFVPPKDGPKLFCTCKLTTTRPFCDGSHKSLPAGPIERLQPAQRLTAAGTDPHDPVDGPFSTAARLGLRRRLNEIL